MNLPINQYAMASNSTRTSKTQITIILKLFYYLLFLTPSCADIDAGTDTITVGQPLRDGEYLRSANKFFRLQFFSPGTSKNKYLGIFYNKPYLTDPVWVANRDNPAPDLFVTLMIDTADGRLKFSYRGGNILVSNSISTPSAKNTSATILDNGNFVVRQLNTNGSINGTLWQSFDYPTNTLLPGMKLGVNLRTGHKWSLTSWTSNDAPNSGSFTMGGDPKGLNQLIVWWQGNVYWTSGVWIKDHFNNSFFFYRFQVDLDFTYISDEDERYLTFSARSNVSLAKVTIDSNGYIDITRAEGNGGEVFPLCPVSRNLETGCVMDMLPKCRKADLSIVERQGSTVGYGYGYDENQNLSLFDCELKCRQNCSCIAFASVYKNGTGCEIFDKSIWFMPSEPRGNWRTEEQPDERVVYFLDNGRATKWWIWLITAVGGTLILLLIIFCYCKRRNLRRKGKQNTTETMLLHELADTTIPMEQQSGKNERIDKKMNQVHLFSLESLEMATNRFSTANKLGEGGFGSVYKGKLPSGQEIAIKRLSRNSGQGLSEFKNEILLIAKLQHDNLVKILGCCAKGQEKILVYEYLPNRSLDFFLFDHSRRKLLKWTNRMNIIEGVAQGILYLHKYSRLRVIHRDLKASNILLDQNMNPKISDFGMARIFGKQESEANTNRIVGTHGYMSPEYAIKGVFSIKTDIFSFGVLLLEIVSGKKNHGCYHPERPLNLIGMAWELWVDGRPIELIDPTVDYSNDENVITRCIHVGLLCVQDDANDRPSMTEVISMLTNESLQLTEPKRPAFFIDTSTKQDESETASENPCTNDLSISVVEGR